MASNKSGVFATSVLILAGLGITAVPVLFPLSSTSGELSPNPTASEKTVNVDHVQVLNTALTEFQTKVQTTGGAQGTFYSSNGTQSRIYLATNGNLRLVSDSEIAPEWLLIVDELFGKISAAELARSKDLLTKINKPGAIWTSAPLDGERMKQVVRAGNLANAVSDLVPLMENVVVKDLAGGTRAVEGTIPSSKATATLAATYNLPFVETAATPSPSPSVSPTASASASPTASPSASASTTPVVGDTKVTFTIDAAGMLVGYMVAPPAGLKVSVLYAGFDPVDIAVPPVSQTISVADLSAAGYTGLPTPTPTPSVTKKP